MKFVIAIAAVLVTCGIGYTMWPSPPHTNTTDKYYQHGRQSPCQCYFAQNTVSERSKREARL